MKEYKVYFRNNIAGSYDSTVILAENEFEAIEKGKPMLNTHKLAPDFLNKYGRYGVEEILVNGIVLIRFFSSSLEGLSQTLLDLLQHS